MRADSAAATPASTRVTPRTGTVPIEIESSDDDVPVRAILATRTASLQTECR
ncbi:MAG: hypothetical protein Q7U78_08005 [Gallionella sp.]|nr:hypothetical protein [Gallionella sp.]